PGKAADHVALADLADLSGIGLDDGLADRDLAVATDHHLAALADRQNRGAVPDRQAVFRCLHGLSSFPSDLGAGGKGYNRGISAGIPVTIGRSSASESVIPQ